MLRRGDVPGPRKAHSGNTTPTEEEPGQPNDSTTRSGSPRLRTSDKEREQVAEILRAAMTEGRLDLAEGEERLAAAYSSIV